MAVPDYQALMGPLLGALADGEARSVKDLRANLAPALGLTEDDLRETIPSGAPLFANRLHWAGTYMAQAGLVTRPRRGFLQITDRGKQAARERGPNINNQFLSGFDEFREFKSRARPERPHDIDPATAVPASDDGTTPLETIEASVRVANADVASQLLERIHAQEPAFLERLVLRVLTAIGYGDAGMGTSQHLGRSGDEGIDGVIRQDALGLEKIYVQAKRYTADRAISRPDIQAFVGALHGQQADRGVFITTSRFTADAREYAERVNARVVLIDGEYLARLMIRYNVGVQDQEIFVIKRLDEEFFTEE